MIKAETIIHEGNPGPNWLDRCKDVFTPQTIGVVLVIVVAVVVGVAYSKHNQTVAPEASSQFTSSSAAANSLKVTSATSENSASPETSSGLQPANNAGDAALPGTTASTSSSPASVGPAPTSSSNSLQSVGGTLQQTTQTVQSLLPPIKNLLTGL